MRFIVPLSAVIALLLCALPAAAAQRSIAPGGCIWVPDKEGGPPSLCPLEHTEMQTVISGSIARVTLTQRFANPYKEAIEATYTFPMSERAAVDRMRMQVGDRVIRGVIKEREEARRIYEAARDRGQIVSLLDQERPNIFTQSVANIMPGEDIEITISYVEYLTYEDGEYTFSFPMTVGPRYNPASMDHRDAGRIAPPVAGTGLRAGFNVSLHVLVDAGAPIQKIESELHAVAIERSGENRAIVNLERQKAIPNRDFILKYSVASNEIGDAILTHRNDKHGYFTLMLHPPARVDAAAATSKEMIFVIDSSGSMSGFPIEKAKATMRRCIENMNPDDTFNLVTFAGGLGYCFPEAMENNRANRNRALAFLDNLQGGGGTEMMPAIRAALNGPYSEQRLRVVCFMTDGFIGNDMEILGEIRKRAASARVFAFGIGSSVNRFLIEGMAREGRGAAEIVTLESGSAAAAERFYERVHRPVLTDITVDFGRLPVADLHPPLERLPDLFSAQPIQITGRYTQAARGTITVHGSTVQGRYRRELTVDLPGTASEHDVLAPLWARARIDALMAEDWQGMQRGRPSGELKEAIVQLGLDYGLVTPFTSFVAVEDRVVNKDGRPRKVEVPVALPDGVSRAGLGLADHALLAAPAAPAPKPMAMRHVLPKGNAVRGGAAMLSAPPPTAEINAPEMAVRHGGAEETTGDTATSDADVQSKIAPELRGLTAKVVGGAYTKDHVVVKDGMVRVFIRVQDVREAHLAQLRKAGVRIASVLASSNIVLADVSVNDLASIARFAFVQRIEAPSF